MIIAVTGPRPPKAGIDYNLKGPVSNWIKKELEKKLNQYKPDTVMCGMAIGVDTIFALLAIEMGIPLFAVLPFIGQEVKWPRQAQDLYHKILAHKSTIIKIVCEPGYADYKFQKRNEWLSNECDLLLGVTDGTPGGTQNCLQYAESIKKTTEIIDLNTYKK